MYFTLTRASFKVAVAATDLWTFIDPQKILPWSEPQVLLCFDESHDLIENGARDPSPFSELRRALRLVRYVPIWTIFISAAEKFHSFAPYSYHPLDPSARITAEVKTYPPITETGFDEFAEHVVSGDPQSTLCRIASTHHMAHLGRAL